MTAWKPISSLLPSFQTLSLSLSHIHTKRYVICLTQNFKSLIDSMEVAGDSLYCTTRQIWNFCLKFLLLKISLNFSSTRNIFSWPFLLCYGFSLLTCFFLYYFLLIRFSQELQIPPFLLTRTNEFIPACIFKLALQAHEAVLLICILPEISSKVFHVIENNLGQVT